MFILIKFLARLKIVVGGKIIKEAIIIGALTIFEALELNLSGLMSFGVVNALARVGNVVGIDRIKNVKLQSPNNISGVFNVA